jgi:vacuolar-type H+-ATPase subunit F/Vma7
LSHLIVLTRPSLVAGFQLAGVEAFSAEDASAAQRLVAGWLEVGEAGLLALDDGLLADFDPAVRRRLEASDQLPFIAIPGGGPLEPQSSRQQRITELIRRAIGFHITFRGAPNP